MITAFIIHNNRRKFRIKNRIRRRRSRSRSLGTSPASHCMNSIGVSTMGVVPKPHRTVLYIAGKANMHYITGVRNDHEGDAMTILTVTARGQVTFRKDVLQHLGIKPGDKIELNLLPDGRGVLKAARPTGSIKDFVGLLAGRTKKVATIEEINEATARGWAGNK